MTSPQVNAPVFFETLPAGQGTRLGVVWLNQPDALNSLSLEMAQAIQAQLNAWESDPAIALVVLRGSGEKAFCAGGDLQTIYRSLPKVPTHNGWSNDYLKTFFHIEYALDHHIHNYSKPVLCWANGIVMGGGAGLMMGASHRVGTPATRFAMPETTIGLFPDVGGTWLLNRLPTGVGRFLALTGASVGVADAHALGIVNYVVPASAWTLLLHSLQKTVWSPRRADNDALLHACLTGLGRDLPDPEPGPLLRNMAALARWCSAPDWRLVSAKIAALETHSDLWLAQAARRFKKACPASVALSFEMLERGRHLSLAQVFQLEYIVALNGTARADFREGIRALLIEKTGNPAWSPAGLDEVDAALIESFFVPPWPNSQPHPLAPLEHLPPDQASGSIE